MKITTEVTHKVDYSELQQTIEQVYGKKFDILEDMDASNDTSVEVTVQPRCDKFDQERIDKWLKTGETGYLARSLMNDMCLKGHIPEGSYVIRISW